MKIAFDIDGTLINIEGHPYCKPDTPRYEVIELYRIFEDFEYDIYIWSGGGLDYAKRWAERLGLDGKIVQKGSFVPDIAIDDEEVKLGKINMKV